MTFEVQICRETGYQIAYYGQSTLQIYGNVVQRLQFVKKSSYALLHCPINHMVMGRHYICLSLLFPLTYQDGQISIRYEIDRHVSGSFFF